MVNIIKGDLISLALQGEFDVIAHGCNCFCKMTAGLAPKMHKEFGCGEPEIFKLESEDWPNNYKGDINKLGQLDFVHFEEETPNSTPLIKPLTVVNAYTQYMYGKNHSNGLLDPYDENAIIMCLKKLNHMFKGMHIGLPYIGCGLASLPAYRELRKFDFERNCRTFLTDCKVTIVEYEN